MVMSPKWILRHKHATSSLEELASGCFENVLTDHSVAAENTKRLVLCAGKVYYHLLEEREKRNINNIALVRLEQLYPFPNVELDQILASMCDLEQAVWCQEEPMNQGAWYSSQHHMRNALKRHKTNITLDYVGRKSSAAPASGYMSVHLEEQAKFIDQALTIN